MDEKEFMRKQIAEIELAKYYEGIRIGRDPGDEFVRKWIKDNAEEYRAINNPSGSVPSQTSVSHSTASNDSDSSSGLS